MINLWLLARSITKPKLSTHLRPSLAAPHASADGAGYAAGGTGGAGDADVLMEDAEELVRELNSQRQQGGLLQVGARRGCCRVGRKSAVIQHHVKKVRDSQKAAWLHWAWTASCTPLLHLPPARAGPLRHCRAMARSACLCDPAPSGPPGTGAALVCAGARAAGFVRGLSGAHRGRGRTHGVRDATGGGRGAGSRWVPLRLLPGSLASPRSESATPGCPALAPSPHW